MQFSSSGILSFWYFEFFKLTFPLHVKAKPVLPDLVGITQSNMSIPSLTAPRISEGVPTPIRYLGFCFGKKSVVSFKISNISDWFSPTASPPIAYPLKLISINFSILSILKSLNKPPWAIPNRPLDLLLPNSILLLLAQLVEVLIAFDNIFLSEVSFGHSSKTIIISELIVFCTWILFSGLNIIFFPSIWELNIAPIFVSILLNFERDIIW